ncbi:hypothetical protein B1218_33255, partial [Pseudomonas ogarae]
MVGVVFGGKEEQAVTAAGVDRVRGIDGAEFGGYGQGLGVRVGRAVETEWSQGQWLLPAGGGGGVALQGGLAEVAGGGLIVLFRRFRIGGWIEAQGVGGAVDSIQIVHAVIRAGDNKTVIVPNGNLSNGIITNTNRQPTRKVVFDVGVDYQADLQKAREVLLALAKDERVLADPAPQAVISTLGDSS